MIAIGKLDRLNWWVVLDLYYNSFYVKFQRKIMYNSAYNNNTFVMASYTKCFFKKLNLQLQKWKQFCTALQRPNTGFADRKLNKWLCHDMAIISLWRGQRNRTHITLPTCTKEMIMKFSWFLVTITQCNQCLKIKLTFKKLICSLIPFLQLS